MLAEHAATELALQEEGLDVLDDEAILEVLEPEDSAPEGVAEEVAEEGLGEEPASRRMRVEELFELSAFGEEPPSSQASAEGCS